MRAWRFYVLTAVRASYWSRLKLLSIEVRVFFSLRLEHDFTSCKMACDWLNFNHDWISFWLRSKPFWLRLKFNCSWDICDWSEKCFHCSGMCSDRDQNFLTEVKMQSRLGLLLWPYMPPIKILIDLISSAGLVRVCGAYLLGICRTNDVCS